MDQNHKKTTTPQEPAAPMNQSAALTADATTEQIPQRYSVSRVRGGLLLTTVGFLIFMLGVRPGLFGLDRSPVIGFVQIATFLVGLGIVCVGGYISLLGLWGNSPLSILADIGSRLVATGYVVSVFSGMADVFGFGSHLPPESIPYFGEWQALGVTFGEAVIAIGFMLLVPFRRLRKSAPKKVRRHH